jgi:dihydroxyacetone kinase
MAGCSITLSRLDDEIDGLLGEPAPEPARPAAFGAVRYSVR